MSEPSLRDTAIEQAHRVIGPGAPQAAAGAAIGVDAALSVIRDHAEALRDNHQPMRHGGGPHSYGGALDDVLGVLGDGDAA
jgi:hypothetical protein